MKTTLTPAAALRIGLWLAVFGAVLFAAPNPRPAPAAAEERTQGATRTYDVYDMVWYSSDGDAPDGDDQTRKAVSDSIVSLITRVIEPKSWEGPDAASTIEERDGRLIVTASDQVHAGLADLLRQLRESSTVQGVSLDCHFILADEAFLKLHAPGVLSRREPRGSVRGISPLKARQIVEAAREVPGVVVIPAPPLPLYSLPTSLLIGEERRLKLPRLGTGDRTAVEISRPAGLGLSVTAVAGARLVTLDLMARSGTLEAFAGAGGAPGGFDEVEGLYHETFVVERSGAFMVRAPLVRARLAGVRGPDGAGENGAGLAGGQAVVREVAAAQSDPPRSLLVVATVRSMSLGELTLLAGPGVAKLVSERFLVDLPDLPPRPPGVPGVLPPPLPPPPPEPPAQSSRAYDLRGLLLGSERGAERAPARAKRLARVLARLKAALRDDAVPMREQYGLLIVNGMQYHYARLNPVIEELSAERLVEPE